MSGGRDPVAHLSRFLSGVTSFSSSAGHFLYSSCSFNNCFGRLSHSYHRAETRFPSSSLLQYLVVIGSLSTTLPSFLPCYLIFITTKTPWTFVNGTSFTSGAGQTPTAARPRARTTPPRRPPTASATSAASRASTTTLTATMAAVPAAPTTPMSAVFRGRPAALARLRAPQIRRQRA